MLDVAGWQPWDKPVPRSFPKDHLLLGLWGVPGPPAPCSDTFQLYFPLTDEGCLAQEGLAGSTAHLPTLVDDKVEPASLASSHLQGMMLSAPTSPGHEKTGAAFMGQHSPTARTRHH